MKRAPVAFSLSLAIGLIGGWYLTSRYDANLYSERFAVMEERLKQAQEAPTKDEQKNGDISQAIRNGSVILSWGGGVPEACGAVLNRAPLARYADRYDLVVACGLAMNNIDRFTDPAITLSGKYSLRDTSQISLRMPASSAMTSALLKFANTEAAKVPPPLRSKVLGVQVTVWYEVILIPTDVLVSDIHTLDDVHQLGGQLLPNEGRGIRAVFEPPSSLTK